MSLDELGIRAILDFECLWRGHVKIPMTPKGVERDLGEAQRAIAESEDSYDAERR